MAIHQRAGALALVCITAALGLATQPSPSMAQPISSEATKGRESEAAGQAGQIRRSQSLNEAADALPALDYSDVLAAPDDPAINLRYAKDLIAAGNIQLAAATIERILLQNPEAHDVRLLYAIMLYRMDVIDDASAQLDILDASAASDAVKAQVAKYRALITQRLNPLKRSAALGFGMHYDSNRNSFPDNDTLLVGDVPILGVTGDIDDWGRFVIGAAEISRDTGKQQLQQVFANATMMYDDQVEVDPLDVRALLVNTGFVYKSAIGDFLPGAHASLLELDREKYARDYALSLRWQRPVYHSKIQAFAEARHGWRRFNNTTNTPFAREQSGHYQKLEAGGQRVFDATTMGSASVAFNRVSALKFESYKGYEIALGVTKLLPRRTFLAVTGGFEKQVYEGPDLFVSNLSRKDNDISLDVTYGVPLSTLSTVAFGDSALPGVMRDVVLNLSATYQNSNSNLPNYNFDNYRGQFMFNRTWDF